jgi:hypothetical protein
MTRIPAGLNGAILNFTRIVEPISPALYAFLNEQSWRGTMRLITYRLEILGTLAWTAACTVIAMQYTSMRGAMAAATGALLGGIAARFAARRGAHLEAAITLCPFVCALLLLGCDGLHRSQFSGTVGGISTYALAEIFILGGTAFCVSLALDLLRAEFPQAAALRVVLSFASFAKVSACHCHGLQQWPHSVLALGLHAGHARVGFFLLASVVIAVCCIVKPRFKRTTGLLALLPQRPLNTSTNA